METKFLLIASLHESLVLRVMDFSNDNLDDAFLGSASFSLAILEEDATQEDISCPIIRDSRECGELRLDVHFYPVGKSSEGTTQEFAGTSRIHYSSRRTSLTFSHRCRHRKISPL